jgi:hypothetical protein
MNVDGFPVEKFKCRVSGTVEIAEEDGTAMRLDRVVVMLVAGRSDQYIPKIIEEDGTALVTRVVKLEHLALLEGDIREIALQALVTNDQNALQGALEFPNSDQPALQKTVDETTGEIVSAPVAAYAQPPEPVDPEGTLQELKATRPHGTSEPTGGTAPTGDEDFEYYDVPVAQDTGTISEPIVVGHVRGGESRTASNGDPSDGPRAGKVSYADLQAIGPDTPAGSPDSPAGERVGSIYPPGHKGRDEELRRFFDEDDPRG